MIVREREGTYGVCALSLLTIAKAQSLGLGAMPDFKKLNDLFKEHTRRDTSTVGRIRLYAQLRDRLQRSPLNDVGLAQVLRGACIPDFIIRRIAPRPKMTLARFTKNRT